MTRNEPSLERLERVPADRRHEFMRQLGLSDAVDVRPSAAQALTDEQQQVWVAGRMLGDATLPWLTAQITIVGTIQTDALMVALQHVYRNSDVFHATFHDSADGAYQVPIPDAKLSVPTVDGCHVALGERPEFLDRECRKLTLPTWSDGDTVVRTSLVTFGPREHVLLWTAHPLVFDNRSAHVLVEVVADAYAAVVAGEALSVVPAYDQYRRWQRQLADDHATLEHIEAWRRVLDGAEPAELPYDRPPTNAALLPSRSWRSLGSELRLALLKASSYLHVSPAAVVVATHAATLSRHTGQQDVVVGMAHDVEVPGVDPRTFGPAGNLLPLRLDLSGHPTFDELVRDAAQAMDAAILRQSVTYRRLLEELDVPRDPGGLPLVTTGVAIDPAWTAREVAGVAFSLANAPARSNRFRLGLDLSLTEPTGGLLATWDATCIDQSTVERFLDRFTLLLEDGCRHGTRRVNALRMLPDPERTQTVNEWNATTVPRPDRTVDDLVAAAIEEHARRTAVVAAHTTMTYADLGAAARHVAAHLIELGVGPESRVGLAMGRDASAIVATLGTLFAGGAFVPVDIDQPVSRLHTILADVGAAVVIVDEQHAPQVPDGTWEVVSVESMLRNEVAAAAPRRRPVCRSDNAAYVLYTSGSTGTPKGVVIEHRSVVNFTRTVTEMFGLTAADRIVQYAASTFDVSIFEMFAALTNGAELHVASTDERRSLNDLTRLLADHEITVCDLPPAIMELLDPDRFPTLRVAFVGGEAFTGELTTRWNRARRFVNGYGPTEATVTVVAKDCVGIWSTSPPIGRAMANHRAYVLNDELEPQPVGVIGELHIAGTGLARGYLGNPGTTAASFVPDPFAATPGERMYRTGDLVHWDKAGDLVFVGRNDRQVKLRGIRIELGEVEAALEAHPQVKQALVVPASGSGGDAMLTAYTVSRIGTPVDPTAMREFLVGMLPEFMIPAQFVHVEGIPLTTSGKVDVDALPAPDTVNLPEGASAQPRTPTEVQVAAEIFAPLLGVPSVDVNANLFTLGGSSLQAIQVVARVRGLFGVDMPIGDFFRSPTVAHVAATVDELLAAARTTSGQASDGTVPERR